MRQTTTNLRDVQGVSETHQLTRESLPLDERFILDVFGALGLSRGEAIRRLTGESERKAVATATTAAAEPDPFNHEPPPNPVVYKDPEFSPAQAAARPVALMVMRQAVADYRVAKMVSDTAAWEYENSEAVGSATRTDESCEWERWTGVAYHFLLEAEARVTACVLILHGLAEDTIRAMELKPGWSPVIYQLDGCHYVVSQTDEGDEPTPKLTVVWDRDAHDSSAHDFVRITAKGGAR